MILVALPVSGSITSQFPDLSGYSGVAATAQEADAARINTTNNSVIIANFTIYWDTSLSAEGDNVVVYNDFNSTPVCNTTISSDTLTCNIPEAQQEFGGHLYIVWTDPWSAFDKIYLSPDTNTPATSNGLTLEGHAEFSSTDVSDMKAQINSSLGTATHRGIEKIVWDNAYNDLYNFTVRREADGSIFDYASTNETKLTIVCPNSADQYFFNETGSIQVLYSCHSPTLKLDISYPTGDSYFRTLIPEMGEREIDFYLIDLNKETAIQKIIELVDLTGEWQTGILRAQTPILEQVEDIIEMEYDVASSVTLYLKKDSIYTLTLINDDGTKSRSIGNLIADSAGTVTITYPPIEYEPEVYLNENITIDYTFNVTAGTLRLQYQDITASTESISWTIYNSTNSSNPLLLQTYSSTVSTGATFTYSPVYGNTTYLTELFVINSLLDHNLSETKLFYDYDTYGDDILPGFSATERDNILFWSSVLFLVVWGLLFSSKHVAFGITSTAIWVVILRSVGWLPISWLWVGTICFVAALTFFVEMMRK